MGHYDFDRQESSSNTQRAAILVLLRSAVGGWISLGRILELRISQYGARIHELRKLGHRIENKSEWQDGKRHSWFRLSKAQSAALLPVSEGWHRDDN